MSKLDAVMKCIRDMHAQQADVFENDLSANICRTEVEVANQAAGECVD